MRKGQQAHVPTPQKNEHFYSYGALELDSGNWVDGFFEKAHSQATIACLEGLLEAYPEVPVVVIWDQATYPTSDKVQGWMDRQDRLKALLLPEYAPELNPVEHISCPSDRRGRVVKQRVAANFTRTVEGLKDLIAPSSKSRAPRICFGLRAWPCKGIFPDLGMRGRETC